METSILTWRGLWLASIVVVVLSIAWGAVNRPSASEEAYFQFDYPPHPETFIFKSTDADTIQEARDILSGKKPSRHVMGTILKEPAGYNPPWSYHLDPESVRFFDNAIEVCDATIKYVEDHLDEACDAFLPGCVWCPWGSRLLAEVTSQLPTKTPTATLTEEPTPTPTGTLTKTPTSTQTSALTPIPTPTATSTPQPTPAPAFQQDYLPIILKGAFPSNH